MQTMGEDVISQLREHGLNVNWLFEMEFFFYFANEDDAEEAMDRLNHKGLTVLIPELTDNGKWLMKGIADLIPSSNIAKLNQWEKDFIEIAAHGSGEFDGWGASPKE
jgi:hypothetical protein